MQNSIGVFDSGIGGLSVVKQIMNILPNENIIYFGDIARIPYGTKSVDTINKFTSETVQFLLEKEVKALVIACNTITAVAYDTVCKLAKDIPVIDVISSGVLAVTENSLYKKVGIIATPATIKSQAYPNSIKSINNQIEVISQECPLLVPLIEESFIKHQALELIATTYLKKFNGSGIDALVLGCTHYPLITETLSKIIGKKVDIIDPAIKASQQLQHILEQQGIINSINNHPTHKFYVTDTPDKFKHIGEMFLNHNLTHIEKVSLSEL
ncbi:MAG: glutamate racemase [Neisseriaceae bacterium]